MEEILTIPTKWLDWGYTPFPDKPICCPSAPFVSCSARATGPASCSKPSPSPRPPATTSTCGDRPCPGQRTTRSLPKSLDPKGLEICSKGKAVGNDEGMVRWDLRECYEYIYIYIYIYMNIAITWRKKIDMGMGFYGWPHGGINEI